MTGEGVLATLHQGWHALAAVDAPRAVIGGLALTAWKHARYTRDADVLVAIDRHRVGEVVAALVAAGFHPRHEPLLRIIDGQFGRRIDVDQHVVHLRIALAVPRLRHARAAGGDGPYLCALDWLSQAAVGLTKSCQQIGSLRARWPAFFG